MSAIIDESWAEAQLRSRGCVYCGASGLATVYHPLYRGSAVLLQRTEDGREHRSVVRCMSHCVCAAGRWMRSKSRDTEVLARVPDLFEVLSGHARWQTQDPTREADPGFEVGASPREMVASIGRGFRVVGAKGA